MKIIGIIAEYNPFHSGHKYQIDYAKKELGADYCVVIMSGPFTQRGTPAIFDKYTRSMHAIKCGADLVIELPVIYATASAESFAEGAVSLLDTLGIVDTLLFGCENPNMSSIRHAATLLLEEPDIYVNTLKKELAKGTPFPKARVLALSQAGISDIDIITSPNNILAVEYQKALLKLHSSIKPIGMQRIGAGYHDLSLENLYVSASAIRNHIYFQGSLPCGKNETSIPAPIRKEMDEKIKKHLYLCTNDFSVPLHYALLTNDSFASYSDCNQEFSHRILRALNNYESFDSFCALLKTKNITHTRISRIMTHIMLGITQDFIQNCKKNTTPPYIRVLAGKKGCEPMLSEIKKRGHAPLVTSPKTLINTLSGTDMQILKTDIFAADLYRCALTNKTKQTFPNEFTHKFSLLS